MVDVVFKLVDKDDILHCPQAVTGQDSGLHQELRVLKSKVNIVLV
jgi:hypothetical protein